MLMGVSSDRREVYSARPTAVRPATKTHVWRQCLETCCCEDEKDRVMVVAGWEQAETAIEAPGS
jgi:hypothetical protein